MVRSVHDVISSLQHTADSLRVEIGVLEGEIDALGGLIAAVEGEIDALGRDISLLEQDIGSMSSPSPAETVQLVSYLQKKMGKKDEKDKKKDDLLKKMGHLRKIERKLSSAKDEKDKKKDDLLKIEGKLSSVQVSVRDGKYFAPTKRVWKSIRHALHRERQSGIFSATNWRKLVRQAVNFDCLALTKKRKRAKLYQSTKDHAKEKHLECTTVNSSRSSTATFDTKQKVWSTDIAGNAIDRLVEGAHLVPAGKSDHVDWFRIEGAAVGLDAATSNVTEMLKATRGCQDPDRKDKRRFNFEGVLHFVSNRLCLTQQKYLIDGDHPCMVVVPLLELAEIRSWAGEGYDAIVLVGEPTSDFPVDNSMTEENIHSAYSASRLNNDKLKIADPSQVQNAARILKDGVLALAEMLLSISEEELKDIETIDVKSAERLSKAKQNLTEAKEVSVPEAIDESIKEDDCRVLLVSFSDHRDDTPVHHVAPDPLLLLLKAANVYGRLDGMHYLANGVIPTFDSESDIEQMELYASMKDMARRRRSSSPTGMLVGAH